MTVVSPLDQSNMSIFSCSRQRWEGDLEVEEMTSECLKMSKNGSFLVGEAEKGDHSCENDLSGNIQVGHKHNKVRSVTAKNVQYS